MTRIQAVGLLEVSPEHDDREAKRDLRNIEMLERTKSRS